MQDLVTIENTTIRQDLAGRYCLNDLHKAAGGEKKHQPSDWLRLQQTKDLIEELNASSIPGIPGIESKQGLGTFVCKELVYNYAMWISPKFSLKVIRTYDSLVSKPEVPQIALTPTAIAEGLIFSAMNIGKLFEVPVHYIQAQSVKHAHLETGVDFSYLLEHAPAQSNVADEDVMLEPTELSAVIGLKSGTAANKLLAELGLQYKEGESWIATDLGKPISARHQWTRGTKSGYNLKWKVEGVKRLMSEAST
jgi:hypothetical protein